VASLSPELLYASHENRNKQTEANIRKKEQEKPGIITSDGVVIGIYCKLNMKLVLYIHLAIGVLLSILFFVFLLLARFVPPKFFLFGCFY
jgi:hypothetical protein